MSYISIYQLDNEHDNIINMYVDGKNSNEIAKHYNIYPSAIVRILNRNNIIMRTGSEANHLRQANYYELNPNMLKRLNGWLLGDGSMQMYKYQAIFELGSIHKSYTDYIAKLFSNTDIKTSQYTAPARSSFNTKKKTISYKIKTRSTIQLGDIYDKWYPNGKKIVPNDLELGSLAIKNWIMDDGSVSKADGRLCFSTQGFTYDENCFLAKKLINFVEHEKIKVYKDRKYYRITLNRIATNKLFAKIGDCEVDCFKYKWNNLKESIKC